MTKKRRPARAQTEPTRSLQEGEQTLRKVKGLHCKRREQSTEKRHGQTVVHADNAANIAVRSRVSPRTRRKTPRCETQRQREAHPCDAVRVSPRRRREIPRSTTHTQRHAWVTRSSGPHLPENRRMPVATSDRRGLALSHRYRRTSRHVRVPATPARRHPLTRALPVRGGGRRPSAACARKNRRTDGKDTTGPQTKRWAFPPPRFASKQKAYARALIT